MLPFIFACTMLCATTPLAADYEVQGVTITLAHNSPTETQTKAQLVRLMGQYNITRWLYTKAVVIDDNAIPHSHPILTLHSRHLKDDDLLLATFLHEELHWYLTQNSVAVDSAVSDLRKIFPAIPIGYPGGSIDEYSNYTHLIVTWLEQRVTAQTIGELRAQQVISFWATDHYTWIYKTLLDRGADIGKVLRVRRLVAPLELPK